MNIALFSDCYVPTRSGVVTVVDELCGALTALGHHVVVVTVKPQEPFEEDPDVYRAEFSTRAGMGMVDQYKGHIYMPKLLHFLKQHNIELIHVHTEFNIGYAGIRAARLLHLPIIGTTHTMWEDCYMYYLPMGNLMPVQVVRQYMGHYFEHFDALVNVSTKARNYYKQKQLCPNVPAVTIPNALNQKKFQGEGNELPATVQPKNYELRHKLGVADDEVMLLFIGRMAEEKRILEMADITEKVMKVNPKVKAVFAGDGPFFEALRDKIAGFENRDRYILPGLVDWNKVHGFYMSGDVFITASMSEMHSMTILEAMSSGLPLAVRADDSYLDTIFQNVNGLIADSDDEMAENIITLVNDAEMRIRFGNAGLDITRGFTIDSFGRRHEALYREVLAFHDRKEPIDEAVLTAALKEVK